MNSFPTKTPYYLCVPAKGKDGRLVGISTDIIEEELGGDELWEMISTSKANDDIDKAKFAYLYKEEFKRLADIAKKRRDEAPSRREFSKWDMKYQSLGIICERKFLRILKEEELEEGTALGIEDLDLLRLYIKWYKKSEKTIRWIYLGDKEKALALKAKLNEVLVDVWSMLTDRSENGKMFCFNTTDGSDKLVNGGAFAPILDSMRDSIVDMEKMIVDM